MRRLDAILGDKAFLRNMAGAFLVTPRVGGLAHTVDKAEAGLADRLGLGEELILTLTLTLTLTQPSP